MDLGLLSGEAVKGRAQCQQLTVVKHENSLYNIHRMTRVHRKP